MNICQLTQKAWVSFLEGLNLDAVDHIYHGIQNTYPTDSDNPLPDTRLVPCIIVECNRARESLQNTGNWTASVRVKFVNSANDATHDEHHTDASEIFSNVWQSNIASNLSAFAGFVVFQVRAIEQGYDLADGNWESYMDLEVECCASDQTP